MGQFVVHTADMIQFEEQQKANVAREKTMLPYSNWRVRDVAMGKSHTHMQDPFQHLPSSGLDLEFRQQSFSTDRLNYSSPSIDFAVAILQIDS